MNQEKRDRLWFAAAFLLPFSCLCSYFIIHRIAPFGDGTFLIFDMNYQYADFFAYFGSVLRGENDLCYCLSRGLGGDFFTLWAYYLANPLDLIPALSPDKLIPAAISLEMMLLFGLTGLSCFYVLSRFVPDGARLTLLFFSAAYALSGWMLVNAENFQFLPATAALPMTVSAIDRLKRGNRILPAIIWLVLSMLLNFYMGYMVWIFAMLWMLLPDEHPHSLRNFSVFGIAALICLPYLIPLIRTLALSIKTPDESWYLPRIGFPIVSLLRNFLPGQFRIRQILDDGIPAVYCGLISILCSIFYFFRSSNRLQKIHRMILLLILLISLIFRPLAMVWQGFSQPHWWPYRFSFLLIFMIILTAAESGLRLHPLLLILSLTGLCFNMEQTFSIKLTNAVSWDNYRNTVAEKRERIDTLKAEDPTLYRIEDIEPRSDNDAMHFSSPGITSFESLTRASSFDFLEKMGFPTDRYTVSYGHGNTGFANKLLGVRYIFHGTETIRNDTISGLAFWADDLEAKLPDSGDPLNFQNALAIQLGVKEPLLRKILPDEQEEENLSCVEEFCWRLSPDVPAYVWLTFSTERDSFLYVHAEPGAQIGNMVVRTEIHEFQPDSSEYFLPLGSVKAGERMTVEIEVCDPLAALSKLTFIAEDHDALLDLGERLFEGLTITKIRSSELRISFPSFDMARMLIVTIPYDSGWHARTESGSLQVSPYLDTFLGIRVPAGITEIVLVR